ncbi:lipid asymmetry maintenance protein MlaB [Aquabacterium sp. J223]|uniref:STAS domain-containing protein n=1 Tax=Aquabacterium sp. J223 TaxID=2898431 RepID=UPI0021ADDA95|nr:STAS domain-containing protein [Aquabacterium sp. J223]UUX94540.1 STAS domain-containing protein [Aquabacterium sp. J223]
MSPPETVHLRVDGEMTIYRAAELKPQLMAALDQAPAVALDLRGVAEIDTAGVQLLLLARRTAVERQRALHLVNPSTAVMDALRLLDLLPHFGDAIAVPAPAGG